MALEGKRLRFNARIGNARDRLGADCKRCVPEYRHLGEEERYSQILSLLLHKRRGLANAVVARSVEHLTEQEEAVLAGKNWMPGTKLFAMFVARWLELRIRATTADRSPTLPRCLSPSHHKQGPSIQAHHICARS